MSRLKIITNPWQLWRLKLESKLTKNSRYWNISENGAKMTRIQIGGYNYLYLSPRGKIRLNTMSGIDVEPLYEWALTDWLKDTMDRADTAIGKMISKMVKKLEPVKPVRATSSHGTMEDQIQSMLIGESKRRTKETKKAEKDREKRKDKFDQIRKGSLASKIDQFDKVVVDLESPIVAKYKGQVEGSFPMSKLNMYKDIDLNPDKYNSSENSD